MNDGIGRKNRDIESIEAQLPNCKQSEVTVSVSIIEFSIKKRPLTWVISSELH